MSVSGPFLVFLGNSVRGRAAVGAAARAGHQVRALVRDPDQYSAPLSGIVACHGDLDIPDSIVAAMRGVAHCIIQLPTTDLPIMVRWTTDIVTAAQRAGVASIILQLASASRPAPCVEPSFVANAAIERIVARSGIAFAITSPTLFLDNLLKPSAAIDIVRHGIFAPPIAAQQRIAWTSADDAARFAIALIEQGCGGGHYRIAGPEAVSGDILAELLTAGFGWPVAYRAQPVDVFEAEVAAALGCDMAERIASKFRYLRDHRHDADAILAPDGPVEAVKGFTPTSIERWAHARRDRIVATATSAD